MSNSLNYVRFDVGHHLYVTHRDTIQKFKDSVLAKYIAPEFDKRQSQNDYIVIDRDGKHFGSILNFMRDPSSLHLEDWTSNDLTDLMREADFYCLSELVELCDLELGSRKLTVDRESHTRPHVVPSNHKLEIIFGYEMIKNLLASSAKSTIVISYQSMRKFQIDSWFAELIKLCDYNKYNVYCFADRGENEICDKALRNFILSLYDSKEGRFSHTINAPEYDKFRARRAHYKCKIFKAWFLIQNDYLN